ncbi:MAG: DUF3037 domain-containing protein [Terriglobales bacterium]
MAALQQLEFFLLRYAGDATKGESINLGLVAIAPGSESTGFADVRFTKNLRRLHCFDPLLNTEELDAMEREIRRELQDPHKRSELIRRVGDAWSNIIQFDRLQGCLTESPAMELETLSSIYLETPPGTEKRQISGRQRIIAYIKNELEAAGVLPFMVHDISVAELTRPGDPMKLDFGYPAEGAFKFLHAVSLTQRVHQGMILAARFPQIAAGMRAKRNTQAWLTAVVDDDLDGSRDEVNFALDMMQDSGIVVARAAEMPGIAEGIRLELRV